MPWKTCQFKVWTRSELFDVHIWSHYGNALADLSLRSVLSWFYKYTKRGIVLFNLTCTDGLTRSYLDLLSINLLCIDYPFKFHVHVLLCCPTWKQANSKRDSWMTCNFISTFNFCRKEDTFNVIVDVIVCTFTVELKNFALITRFYGEHFLSQLRIESHSFFSS